MPTHPILFQNSMGIGLFEDNGGEVPTMEKFSLPHWKNIFMFSATLSDEIRYVYERQNRSKLVGNGLEKPTLLMKRD